MEQPTRPGKTIPPHPKKMLEAALGSKKAMESIYSLVRTIYPDFPSEGSTLVVRAILGAAGIPSSLAPNPHQVLLDNLNRGWSVVPPSEPLQPGDLLFLGRGSAKVVTIVVKQPKSVFEERKVLAVEWLPEERNSHVRLVSLDGKSDQDPVMAILRLKFG